ncbi:bifunctional [glutamate--ammonia ligase]-adenylyl-L-tyrosine phosphorylase/[glutamate--ammonia-ligase] adenylyltransferase [Thermomonas sp. HDW16]|uniref:bifunctional [glutamate--ammonia ligase]-adenylyl-L-tyrosine phosphorylase/[glutamate--ammonia-ligase] adenylyltransferase n=1 Tax=Thermomonas sp. HDW16 TaxID=2714945 RepID=UPI00140A4183|nr:bifunctional [glutamate--ammonia ligase]-adenylyl-L-tyrosine phosphorylase/[glutamate--ammonia-ligase] adenylyltransferase [Thermomonas sp. HDW16]QIL19823.1 bifunctional [glutamate--ammonia ligase]-adenylyl-L-tyrosine phosphorylase/[glutamate--ammonia-ligase] adenylyltransferase [Thermomonas sp. HDW16]
MHDLQPHIDRKLALLPADAAWRADAPFIAKLRQLAIASDFALATLATQPDLIEHLQADDGATPATPPMLDAGNRADWPRLLRRYRQAESTRLVWRDVIEGDPVDAILAGSTALAETCLQLALGALEAEFAQRFGNVRDADGVGQQLVVFGLGKLGGGELNFSSDIDLVYAYEHDGDSDGARSLAASDYFARLGQQLAKLLDEVTADGFSHRVDLRLRPFGNAGRVALSFAAMEQYFQREGRDWERYAWQKARPVAGDLAAGDRFLAALRPFVYRRYLDYGALDGLRTMKAAIAAEVARKELADDIKRGPGGIREIEFLVQALQLIRGGREPELRERRLLPALQALVQADHLDAETADALARAYRYLRVLENRIQMMGDAQTHALPADELQRERVTRGLGHADMSVLDTELAGVREYVASEFAGLLAPRKAASGDSDLALYWRNLPDDGDASSLASAGFEASDDLHRSLCDFARAPGVRELSDATRARLDRVLPALLQAAANSSQPDAALRRLLPLLHTLLKRASYLALLDEQPAALQRLVDALARSALLGERLAAHPLLLDELLDRRVTGDLPDRETMQAECAVVLRAGDAEASLQALNEVRQALSFRIALALLDARCDAQDCARRLAWLADAVVTCVLRIALEEMHASHGGIDHGRFAVLGYGSLGGEELGFGSDLDLVFLYDAPDGAASDGARALDASRWFARLGQKIVSLLGVDTGAGRLFEVDVRLRPDGAKGLLVSSLASFSEYQRERAWTWEHQALVRARCAAGDAGLCGDFERLREAVLARLREPIAVAEDVSKMRRKMRAELDRSDAALFDIKQGEGGLVDLEFLLQSLVLRNAASAPALCIPRATPLLIDAAQAAGRLDVDTRDALQAAHAVLLDAGLRCTLDRRPRRVPLTPEIEQARGAIRAAVQAQGLRFDGEEKGAE